LCQQQQVVWIRPHTPPIHHPHIGRTQAAAAAFPLLLLLLLEVHG
jgi:hypothetical protein